MIRRFLIDKINKIASGGSDDDNNIGKCRCSNVWK